jgi:hypothetical protein
MRHDLLLTGGHVIDPASGVDGRRDDASGGVGGRPPEATRVMPGRARQLRATQKRSNPRAIR